MPSAPKKVNYPEEGSLFDVQESLDGFDLLAVATDDDSKGLEIDFDDVVDTLMNTIENVNILKPWKKRALKAENLNNKLSLALSKLKDELKDAKYDLQKWKKRAVRAEQENQAEILKWKSKVKSVRESRTELLEDDDTLLKEGETLSNLVSKSDDDNEDQALKEERAKARAKVINKLTGNSFRDKWNNLDINATYNTTATTSPEEILKNLNAKQGNDGSHAPASGGKGRRSRSRSVNSRHAM